jgi:L-amino acid N-acyltransferase YncA
VIIRLATAADFTRICEMGKQFWAQTAYSRVIPYCSASIVKWSQMMLEQEMLFVAEEEGRVIGAAGALIAASLGNVDYYICTELFWYLEPEHRNAGNGIALMRKLESEATSKGVVVFSMIALEAVEPAKVSALYTREGYELTERVFTKVLKWPQ